MKTFKFLSITLMVCMLGLSSCSKDDDGKSEGDLSEASKAFVGLWKCTSQNYDEYVFLEDGVCQYMKSHLNEMPYRPTWTKGYWTYNAETSILATTIEQTGQWQVALSNKNSWAGTNVNSNTYTAFNKATNFEYLNTYILNRIYIKWRTDNDTKGGFLEDYLEEIKENLLDETLKDVSYEEMLADYVLNEDENENDFVFEYKFNVSYRNAVHDSYYITMAEGKFTVVNPYSSTKCQLVFTGDITKTFTIDSFIY